MDESAQTPTRMDSSGPIHLQQSESTSAIISRILPIAIPIWLSNSLFFFVNILTAVGVGSVKDASAIGLGQAIVNIFGVSLVAGYSTGLDTLCTQAVGSKQYKLIGVYTQRAFVMMTITAAIPIAVLFVFFMERILLSAGVSEDRAAAVAAYIRIRAPSLLSLGAYYCIVKSVSAVGRTYAVFVANLVASAVGIGLVQLILVSWDWGVQGAALVQTLREATQLLILVFACLLDKNLRRCWGGWSRAVWQDWCPFAKLAAPATLMQNVEWWNGAIINILVQYLGQEVGGIQTLAGTLNSLLYAGPQSIGVAANTIVGQLLGSSEGSAEERAGHGKRAAVVVIAVGLLFGVVLAGGALLLQEPITNALKPSGCNATCVEGFLRIIPLVCLNLLLNSTQNLLTGVIKASGFQSKFALYVILCYWVVGLPVGSVLAFYAYRESPASFRYTCIYWGVNLAIFLQVVIYCYILVARVSLLDAAKSSIARITRDKSKVQDIETIDDAQIEGIPTDTATNLLEEPLLLANPAASAVATDPLHG